MYRKYMTNKYIKLKGEGLKKNCKFNRFFNTKRNKKNRF